MRSMCDGERGLRGRGEALEPLLARPESPSRCTFPITALRVMPPSSAAIWLAERPSDHSFFRSSTRSSVHDMPTLLEPVGQAVARIPPRGRAASRHPTHTQPQRFRRLSAARNVVLDNQKATIWLESGARLARFASTYSCARVDELGTNRVRNAQLSCVDSGAGGNRMVFRAARRGGTFHLRRAGTRKLCEPNREPEREWGRDIPSDGDFCARRPRLRAG